MVTLLTGENSFEIERELARLVAGFDGAAEKIDGESLESRQLPDILMGTSLFHAKRLVIIDRLSASPVWAQFDTWLERVSDDIHLVLVEPKPDKRTTTYKQLQKKATLHDFPAWTQRDQARAIEWAMQESAEKGASLSREQARYLVARAGVDQWRLYHAIEKLALAGELTPERIDVLVDATPDENVFTLLETALRGDSERLYQMIHVLRQTEDPYRIAGLLSTQLLQLAALALSDKPAPEVARDIKTAPFVVSKMAPFARRVSRADVRRLMAEAAACDYTMKSSALDPWVAVERLLLKIALG